MHEVCIIKFNKQRQIYRNRLGILWVGDGGLLWSNEGDAVARMGRSCFRLDMLCSNLGDVVVTTLDLLWWIKQQSFFLLKQDKASDCRQPDYAIACICRRVRIPPVCGS